MGLPALTNAFLLPGPQVCLCNRCRLIACRYAGSGAVQMAFAIPASRRRIVGFEPRRATLVSAQISYLESGGIIQRLAPCVFRASPSAPAACCVSAPEA